MPPSTHLPRRSDRNFYILIALAVACSLGFFLQGASAILDQVTHGSGLVRQPMLFGLRLNVASGVLPEAKQAGMRFGDTVTTINGRPFTGVLLMMQDCRNSHPGDLMQVGYLHKGVAQTASIHLQAEGGPPLTLLHIIAQDGLLYVAFPLLCLVLGTWVLLAKPRDPNAWLLFGIFCFFQTNIYSSYYWPYAFLGFLPFVGDLFNTAGPLCIMLFGIYFPERSNLDIRYPWIKWLILAPVFALFPFDLNFTWAYFFHFSSAAWLEPFIFQLEHVESYLSMASIGYFFVALSKKIGSSTIAADARRRLKLLYWGATVGCTPLLMLVVVQIIRHHDTNDAPHWILVTALSIFTLFPLTLAYVVIVQRAMDVRIILRQGTKYAFARGTITVIRFLLAGWMAAEVMNLTRHPGAQRNVDLVRIFGILALFFAFRFRLSKKLQQVLDQRFFREAYSSEQVLSELSEEVRNFTEVTPLLTTVVQRISATLHVERIAVFLRSGDGFRLQMAIGVDIPQNVLLPAGSSAITTLSREKGPATVYADDPSSWFIDASDAERAALSELSTELLVPLPGRNRLIGVLALGPKRSEEPYSRTDRQLLQTVASQTGLALENAELLHTLAAEAAQRERISREIEIAREVQERLFPQSMPVVAGATLAGFCRPAQGVGGDYYDAFTVEDASSRVLLAIGDVSGKGISAALVMASLRASLRGITLTGSGDLAVLMRSINRLVYDSSTSNRYATFFYGEYDPSTRMLHYVNAGHNAPVVLRPGKITVIPGKESVILSKESVILSKESVIPTEVHQREVEGPAVAFENIHLEATGTVIGLLPDAEYQQASLQLQPGDLLIAFTDGISEAMNYEDEEWGEERMIAAAHALLSQPDCNHSAQDLLDCIFTAADRFTAGAPQHDDMTLLVLKLN